MTNEDILKAIKVHEESASALRAQLAGETVVAVIIDESGSMEGTRDATISGVNEYMQDRAKDVPNAKLFLTKFSYESTKVYEGIAVKDYVPLTRDTYKPNGGTALRDAVGDTLAAIDKLNVKKALILIVTDGEENASKRFSREQIKTILNQKEKEDDRFTFVYMGANQDAWSNAQALGLSNRGNTLSYNTASSKGALRGVSAGAAALFSSSMSNSLAFAADVGLSTDLTNLPADSTIDTNP